MAHVIAVATQKGGVGKTTTAQTLASIFAQRDQKKVLLVDCDMQRNLTMYVGLDDDIDCSVYSMLEDSKKVHEAILHLDSYDFIPATSELSLVDIRFSASSDIFLLDDALDLVKDQYDFIILDCGPQRSRLLAMVYVCADYVVCPTDDTEGGVEGLISLNEDINKYKNAKHPLSKAEVIGAVLTRCEPRTRLHRGMMEILENVMKEINPDGFALYVRKALSVSETKATGKSVQEYAPHSNASIDYREVADAVLHYIERKG